MNKDQVKGRVKEATGKMQKNMGRSSADEDVEVRGAATEVEGKVQKNVGDIKRKIGKAIDR